MLKGLTPQIYIPQMHGTTVSDVRAAGDGTPTTAPSGDTLSAPSGANNRQPRPFRNNDNRLANRNRLVARPDGNGGGERSRRRRGGARPEYDAAEASRVQKLYRTTGRRR